MMSNVIGVSFFHMSQGLLHPADAHLGSAENSGDGVEPEMLFTMELPAGWTQCFGVCLNFRCYKMI